MCCSPQLAVSLPASCKLILHNIALCSCRPRLPFASWCRAPDCDHTSAAMPTSPHHVRPDGFRIFLERPTLVAVCMELQQLFDNDTRAAPQASRLVSDGSHRQHRWSLPTTSARSTALQAVALEIRLRHKFVPAATRPSHCRHPWCLFARCLPPSAQSRKCCCSR